MLMMIAVWFTISMAFLFGWIIGWHFGWYAREKACQRNNYVEGDEDET